MSKEWKPQKITGNWKKRRVRELQNRLQCHYEGAAELWRESNQRYRARREAGERVTPEEALEDFLAELRMS
jgi:hypothetical protein